MRRPHGEGWEKVPSVTTGGKPFFWYRRVDGRRQWWVWDRAVRQWVFREE